VISANINTLFTPEVDQFFPSANPKVDHFFPGVGGSVFSQQVDHFFLDDRTPTPPVMRFTQLAVRLNET
jgi:hypothetical protein